MPRLCLGGCNKFNLVLCTHFKITCMKLTTNKFTKANYLNLQKGILLILRIAVGWHFLYEGMAKLLSSNWTSFGYLSNSKWIFADFFHWIANSPEVLRIADILNIWGLILIGLALFFGIFTRFASVSGFLLLLLYYSANPPFVGMDYGVPTEGHYLIVNKNLIEMFILLFFVFLPTDMILGIDRLWLIVKATYQKEKTSPNPYKKVSAKGVGRRELIKNLAALPIFGGYVIASIKKKGWLSYEEKFLQVPDAVSSATAKSISFTGIKDLREKVPSSKIIGGMDISRVILGGNLIGGWAHARELIYVSELVKSYHTNEKVYDTFRIAEECGINTIITNQILSRVINGYWRRGIGNMQFISDCGSANLVEGAKISIDSGATACYIHGGYADSFASAGRIDKIQEAWNL